MEWGKLRNRIAFWLLGLCTDFGYIVMLSGAEDIIKQKETKHSVALGYCEGTLTSRRCSSLSTGAVLLADMLPAFILKVTLPFYMEIVPIDIRHVIVVALAFAAFIVVAFAENVTIALTGVVFASLSLGLGEASYMSFISFFDRSTISFWSSGTGGASIFGSVIYAGLTEPHFANLSSKTALLVMLCVPVILVFTYTLILKMPKSIYRIKFNDPRTWVVPQWYRETRFREKKGVKIGQCKLEEEVDLPHKLQESNMTIPGSVSEFRVQKQLTVAERLHITLSLSKFMVPLIIVYFAEYMINQGLTELIIFDCFHGFHLGQTSQYRWYQTLYQAGVFISRSTSGFYNIPLWLLYLLPILQLTNALLFFLIAMYFFIPHISILLVLIFMEGLIGGTSYVNTYKQIYSHAKPDVREFSLAVGALSDAVGIVAAGFLSIPLHNYICSRPLP